MLALSFRENKSLIHVPTHFYSTQTFVFKPEVWENDLAGGQNHIELWKAEILFDQALAISESMG